VAYSRWRDTSKLVHAGRSRALRFGGVLDLKSLWKLGSSTERAEESGGPERAGPRQRKYGTAEVSESIDTNLTQTCR
jgi:hypothetical protein